MAKDVFTIPTKVLSVEPLQKFNDERYKIVFYCKSSTEKPRTCILWGAGKPQDIREGDEVVLTGRIKNNVFLCYTAKVYAYLRKEEQRDELQG